MRNPRLEKDVDLSGGCSSCEQFEEWYYSPEVTDPWRMWFDWLRLSLKGGDQIGVCNFCLRRAARYRDELILDAEDIRRYHARQEVPRESDPKEAQHGSPRKS